MKRDFICLLLFCALWPVLPLIAQTANHSPQELSPLPRIEWDNATLSLVHTNGDYARIIRLKNRDLLCGFDFRGKIFVRHSSDDGKTWREPVMVAESSFAFLTNTELLQLRDGTVLCFYNQRPQRNAESQPDPKGRPFAICMARSDDNGKTWQPAETLYTAGAEFTNGCWEPAAIQLASGEIQLFFANEGPYRDSDEQEITLLRSHDDARTWSAPERISFRAAHRDGMPVPLVLEKDRGIAVAIEDNGLSGNFKPVIVFTSLTDNWRSGVRDPSHTHRWSALRTLPEPHVAASAPYLRQMPSGETLLSFQRTDTGEIRDAYMVVCIGDATARHFDSASRPFAIADRRPQLWNSLFVKDDDTVVAISNASINGVRGIWTIEGRFVRK
jgi:hypothetical protein